MRLSDPKARGRRGCDPKGGASLSSGLHGAEDTLAQTARAEKLRSAPPRAFAARLSQFPTDWKLLDGVWRCIGHGPHGHPPEELVAGGCLDDRFGARRLASSLDAVARGRGGALAGGGGGPR